MGTRQSVTSKGPAGARKWLMVRLVGGPTVCDIGGLGLPNAPTFDALGPVTCGSHALACAGGPAAAVENVGTIHAALLAHDQHAGNVDGAGPRLLANVSVTLTTSATVDRPGRNATALPALAPPDGGLPGRRLSEAHRRTGQASSGGLRKHHRLGHGIRADRSGRADNLHQRPAVPPWRASPRWPALRPDTDAPVVAALSAHPNAPGTAGNPT
ncbi:hypothetical protein [Streptomyces sp. NBC_00316]|uniref:hypothetical protein n=1 Tax=Streptomyces sp. NBC_00316 TaxID=2975710 RepID=UPI002E2BCD1E|nr:hypothetical protein [Streptomyces sp. NBC_00316]